jgi:hypothetical protein
MKNMHIEHVEDLLFEGQFIQSVDTLQAMLDALIGSNVNALRVTTKYDGSPAVVFGTNPENGRFFVGTKSVFNKRQPKINYSLEDIERNHAGQAELIIKLGMCLNWLGYMSLHRRIPQGVFQGDLMFTSDSVRYDEKSINFTPNTITYHITSESRFSDNIPGARIGMVVHTSYIGDTMAELEATSYVPYELFDQCREVYFIDPRLNVYNYMLTQDQYATLRKTLVFCEQAYRLLKDRSLIQRHGKMLKMFHNHCIRIGETKASIGMYRVFLTNRGETALSDEAGNRLIEFNSIFGIHEHLAFVKKGILGALNASSMFYHTIGQNFCHGEGFVVTYHGVPIKLIDRFEFSRNNFANMRFQKAKAA